MTQKRRLPAAPGSARRVVLRALIEAAVSHSVVSQSRSGLPVGLDGVYVLPQRRARELGGVCRADMTVPLPCTSAGIRT